MTKLFAGTPHAKFIAAASAVILTIAIATSARGVQLQAGRVTQVVNDVKLRGKEAPRPVALGDLIRHGAPVSTGTQSRSELTFNDLTITRLGANTTFSFKEGTREMNLIDGAILFQVPKGSGGATIRTAGVTAAITGTTGIGEFHPATSSHPQPVSKWLCLEGTFHLYLPNGQSVEVGPGKMVTTDGESFSPVLTFDIARLVSTSLFFTGFDRPLPSLDLIVLESQKQLASMLFAPSTTNPLDPARIVNVTSQAIVAEEAQTSPPPPPLPTPSEFGTPAVISSPVPYLITNGTVIKTDPSITTNGVTDFGKIYRGPVDDGAFSLWAFGSTSAIDTTLDFDTNFENAGHFPLAAFKFTSLVLAGNPTIDLTNGVTNLALISVGDITSGLPGGTLTFSGLDALLLASQDGSINLGSEIAFQGIPTLFFYARGTNGDLTLASPIIGTTDLFLYAGRNITFNAGTDLILGGQFSTRSAGGNISVSESGNIAIGGSLAATSDVIADAANGGNITFATGGSFSASDVVVETTVEPGVTLTDGANISFDIGTSLTVNGGSLSLTINDSNGGTIGTGGNITLNTGANLTVNGSGALTLSVLNNNGGNIGTGGNISVTTGGDLTAGSIDALIDNSLGGTIGGSANLAFNLSGQLATQSDTSFTINNSNGGMIGSDAAINVSAASISTVGSLFANILNFASGNIVGGADLSLNLTGDLATQGDALLTISNDTGGTIGSDAVINVTAANILTGGALNAAIINSSGGSGGNIVGSANINFNLTGDLTTAGDVTLSILNDPGTIGGNTAINVDAANITANSLLAQINNTSGTIGGNANINFNLTGDLQTVGDASFSILNGGGTIGGDSSINVNAASISIGGSLSSTTDVTANTASGGNIAFAATGGSFSASDVVVETSVEPGVTLTDGANITFDIGTSLTVNGGSLSLTINDSNGGTIGTGGKITLNTGANLTVNGGGALTLDVLNNNGGHIGTGGNISVTTGGDLTAGSIDALIDNSNGGGIGSGANVTLNVGGDLTTQGDATFQILNFDDGGGPGTIGVDAVINVAANNISTGGALDAGIISFFGSTIGGNATVNVTAANITTGGVFLSRILNENGASIGGDAAINLTANTLSVGNLSSSIENFDGSINGSANINFNLTGDLTTQGDAGIGIEGAPGGTIGSNATVNVTANNISTGGNLSAIIINQASGTIGLDAAVNVSAASILTVGTLNAAINNGAGTIGGSANVNFNLTGDLTTGGDAAFQIVNGSGGGSGTIGSNATVNVTANNLSTGGNLGFTIDNPFAATIGGSATVNVTANNLSTGGNLGFTIDNSFGSNIGGNTTISVTAANIVANSLLAQIDNFHSGIGSGANVTLNVGGDLTTVGDATLLIRGGGGIGSDAAIDVTAANVSTGTLNAAIDNSSGGTIGGSANVNFNLTGDLTTGGDAAFQIANSSGGVGTTIGSHAMINVTANNVSTGTLNAAIDNSSGGTIGGMANLFFVSGDLTATSGDASFRIDNANRNGFSGGSINGDAIINIGGGFTNNFSAQGTGLFAISNDDAGSGNGGGTILSSAIINVTAANISTGGPLSATIDNFGGGTIGGDALINVNAGAGNITANSLLAQIDNTGGTINGSAAIDMAVSGNATITNDATVAISGNDPAGPVAINFNGGSYDVGGTFLSQIDGNGALRFNNASAHADVLKAGVFGANGALNIINGGMLSADTTLKLYAPGSNGELNFMSNVTLGGNSAKILAANSVTIFNNIVVTIGGPNPADVFTNNANYTGFGGNNSTTGTFDGAGANNPQPLINAPPFGASPIATRTRIHPRPPSTVRTGVINVSSSDELLALLDDLHPGRDGRIRIPASKSTNNSRNSNRVDAARLNAPSRLNADRREMDRRTASTPAMRRLPQ